MQIVHDYRTLHTIPELDRTLPKTVFYICRQLAPLKCRVFTPAPGAVCGFFDFGKEKTLAFRADTDALPIFEQTGSPWASRHPGRMHACGHDGHTAILLELARRLHQTRELSHNVLLIFQPGEETDGGAQALCEAGILQNVTAIFGLHLWPGLPAGQLFSRPGVLMSRSQSITARFTGKSVHIARFGAGQDALGACIRFYRAAENLCLPFPYLLKFGKLAGGSAGNVVCEDARLWGSLRTRQDAHSQAVQDRLQSCMRAVCQHTGCRGQLQLSPGYPAVDNSPALWEQVQAKCPVNRLDQTFWTADDFSFYQRQVPGLYFLLGTGDTPPLHSPEFAFDEEILPPAAAYLYTLCTKL